MSPSASTASNISSRTVRLTAVCGGIGSGKSMVCSMLTAMGFPVYNCDSRAKALMDSDPEIRKAIARDIAAEALFESGEIDRRTLSAIVFADARKLATLNAIVHGAVRDDIARWTQTEGAKGKRLFVETAILMESGLDRMVDEIWLVTAPEEVRITRVGRRSGLTPEQTKSRIAMQKDPDGADAVIVNDGVMPLLPQIERLI